MRLPFPAWLLPSALFVTSLIAWTLYASDKRKARLGQWRQSEFTLQGISLLGGWPGALLAQRYYRHKTSKLSFQIKFWIIVILHQIIAVDILLDHTPGRWFLEKIRAAAESALFPSDGRPESPDRNRFSVLRP